MDDGMNEDVITLLNENYQDNEDHLLKSLEIKSSISSIILKSCFLTTQNFTKLINAIKDLSYIFEIDLSNNNLGSFIIPNLFENSLSPTTLILDNINLGDDGFILLSKYVENVRILSVSSNQISSRGAIVFFNSISNSFTSLNLSNNIIDDSAIFSMKTDIKKLDLSSNNFTQCGLASLSEKLSKSHIKSLSLNDMKLPKTSLTVLLKSKSLKQLYLRNCSISLFPDIPSESKLQLLDLSVNENLVDFSAPSSLTIIGNISTKQKVELNFRGFSKIFDIVDELQNDNVFIVENSVEITNLYERIRAKAKELTLDLQQLKRKVKPSSVRSLSKYASRISNPNELIKISVEPKIEGFVLSKQLPMASKIDIFNQFLVMFSTMLGSSKYLRNDFKIDSFMISKNKKLIIKDNNIITKEKSSFSSTIESFASQLFGYIPDFSLYNSNFLHSLLTSSIFHIRNPPAYTVNRTQESMIDLFSKLNTIEIMTHFKLSVEGESAIDHGGVQRDIFTQFWDSISLSKFEMSDTSVSLLPIQSSTHFREIGQIMLKSMLESIPISIPIHSIVFRFILNQLPQGKTEWAQSLSEFDPQLSGNIEFEAENDEIIIERCKDILINRRINELNELKNGFFCNGCLKTIIENMYDWWTLMSDIIGEEKLEPNSLIKEIKFINLSKQSVKLWVDVIKTFTKEETKQLLRLVTGLNGMPAGGYRKRGKQLIFSKSERFFAHTCSFELETPEFKNEKEIIETLRNVFIAMESDYSMNEWYQM